ncbi:hypothetical protein RF55_19223 [Lasius niger]|uniref:Uncharacterized protein n=1 Tax=Lasius niger TaxID=67767 RepID=A0A0J7JZW7_LASNI|nr:hypothetical protein RF55_19223 [Lasius niger]
MKEEIWNILSLVLNSTINEYLSCECHEEADTKIVHHICKIEDDSNILIKSSDTDILVIMLEGNSWVEVNGRYYFHWFDGDQFPQSVFDAVATHSLNIDENTSDNEVETRDEEDSYSEDDLSADERSASSDED